MRRRLTADDETHEVTVELETADAQFDRLFPESNTYSPIVTFRDAIYAVWVGADDRPVVAKISGGVADVRRLDPNDDYQVENDSHRIFSIGIGPDGFVHIVGDQHNYGASFAAVDHMPERYRDGIAMHWISDAPEDVSSFTWVGEDSALTFPGYAFTYASFHYDDDGDLYMQCRNRVHRAGHEPGEIGYSIYAYDPTTRAWEALGALPPSTSTAEFPAVFWEDDAYDKPETDPNFYQAFSSGIRFDENGRLHAVVGINGNSLADSASHVLYARSDDGGRTFARADGSALTLPLRVEEGAGQADVVAGPDDVGGFPSPCWDRDGSPIVSYSEIDPNVAMHRAFDEEEGVWAPAVVDPIGGSVKNACWLDPRGVLTLVRHRTGRVHRLLRLGEPGYELRVGDRFAAVDELAMREGLLRGFAIDGDRMQIVTVRFDNALCLRSARSGSRHQLFSSVKPML